MALSAIPNHCQLSKTQSNASRRALAKRGLPQLVGCAWTTVEAGVTFFATQDSKT